MYFNDFFVAAIMTESLAVKCVQFMTACCLYSVFLIAGGMGVSASQSLHLVEDWLKFGGELVGSWLRVGRELVEIWSRVG